MPRGTRALDQPPPRRSPTGLSPALARLPRRFGSCVPARSGDGSRPRRAPQPPRRNGCRLGTARVWAQAPVAHHYWGPRCCFLLLGVLRCFSSPGSPRPPMDSAADAPASPGAGCPIRRSADHSPSTAPRGFSQSPASFLGPWRLGIPRAPSLARRPSTGTPSLQDRIHSIAHCSSLVKDRPPGDKEPIACARGSRFTRQPRRCGSSDDELTTTLPTNGRSIWTAVLTALCMLPGRA